MKHYTYPDSMMRVVNELSKLPSVGEKTAVRLAYFLMTRGLQSAPDLARAIQDACEQVRYCESCFALADTPLCSVCADECRDRGTICVVEKPADLVAIERSRRYNGVYHVLHGLWSPIRGITPEKTKMPELLERVSKPGQKVNEVILATATTVEGDATAMYLAQLLEERGILVSRIAQGLPQGGELEYSDEVTLSYAIERRRAVI